MNAVEERTSINQITEKILGCAYRVANSLGCGFLEKVYENALAHEMRKAGLRVVQQASVAVHYDGIVAGEYIADLPVEDRVLVELKAAKGLDEIHQAQGINYLKATGLKVGLLINFGTPTMEVKRLVRDF